MRENWKTISLAKCIKQNYIPTKIPRKRFQESGAFPIVSQEKKLVNGYWSDESAVIRVEFPLVVFGDHTRVLKYIDFDFVVGADGTKLLQPKHFLNAKYFYYFLMAHPLDNLGYARHYRLLKELTIKFPESLSLQHRIVSILDDLFAGITKMVANTEKNLANARELFESKLNEVFMKKEDKWVKDRLEELTTKIGSGATPKGGSKSYKDHGISLIRSLNVYDRSFRPQKLAFIDNKQAGKLSNVIVKENDVLFNITGASIARCCVVPKEILPARVNQHVSILRPRDDRLSSTFLCYLMTSKPYKDIFLGIGDDGGSTRQAITKKQLQELNIAIPKDIDEQDSITVKLNQLQSKTQRLERIYKRKLELLSELKQSILHKAFTGELAANSKHCKREVTK